MNIVSCSDYNFIIPLGVMMHSLCINNESGGIVFHIIIDNSVTKEQKEQLHTVVSDKDTIFFYNINIDNIKDYLIVKIENFPIPIYYRLLMARILPASIHKVLYLDADIIVRHDLSKLWNTSIENFAVAAIPNQSNGNRFWERLNYSKDLGYFNSGVLLLNLDYIRENNLTEQFISYVKENPEKLLMPDQDVLNYTLRHCKKNLPVCFNAQEGFYRIPPESVFVKDFDSDISDPFIVHYTKEKPWNKNCKHPLRNLYYYYKSGTIWKDNYFMENFKYKKIRQPLFIRLKIFLTNLFYNIKKDKVSVDINYRKIHLKK